MKGYIIKLVNGRVWAKNPKWHGHGFFAPGLLPSEERFVVHFDSREEAEEVARKLVSIEEVECTPAALRNRPPVVPPEMRVTPEEADKQLARIRCMREQLDARYPPATPRSQPEALMALEALPPLPARLRLWLRRLAGG